MAEKKDVSVSVGAPTKEQGLKERRAVIAGVLSDTGANWADFKGIKVQKVGRSVMVTRVVR